MIKEVPGDAQARHMVNAAHISLEASANAVPHPSDANVSVPAWLVIVQQGGREIGEMGLSRSVMKRKEMNV